jgi:hypothetical protein
MSACDCSCQRLLDKGQSLLVELVALRLARAVGIRFSAELPGQTVARQAANVVMATPVHQPSQAFYAAGSTVWHR